MFAAATAASLCWWDAATADVQHSLEESTTPLLTCFKPAGLLRWEALVVHQSSISSGICLSSGTATTWEAKI